MTARPPRHASFWQQSRDGGLLEVAHVCVGWDVEVMGFEPTASSMRPKRSSQLSYTPVRDGSS